MQKTIKNRTIFCRDNIEILKGIDNNTIDLIYLDPPFNKNKDFTAPIGSTAEGASFKDIFGIEDIKNEWVGLIAEEHPTLHNYLTGISDVGYKSNKYYLCYMAVRIIECHRILKDTGSLYLHCDPTMSHYLKILLDCIFGEKNFRNEIVWWYNKWSNTGRIFQANHDTLFFYSKSEEYNFNKLYDELSERQKAIRNTGYNSGSSSGVPILRVYDRKKAKDKIEQAEKEGRRVYYVDNPLIGNPLPSVWDISYINSQAKERTGYPTQKPLKLLRRIIEASSNEGDVVLDPFCGCATACIAAEKLGRKWVGIDISKKAFDLVRLRLGKEIEEHDTLFYESKIQFRDDIPLRTDTDFKPDKLNNKHYLFGRQEGKCNGCGTRFDFRHFHIDHIYPQSKGGGDNIENLQLLCGSCNMIKGDRDMAYLMARLREIKAI